MKSSLSRGGRCTSCCTHSVDQPEHLDERRLRARTWLCRSVQLGEAGTKLVDEVLQLEQASQQLDGLLPLENEGARLLHDDAASQALHVMSVHSGDGSRT